MLSIDLLMIVDYILPFSILLNVGDIYVGATYSLEHKTDGSSTVCMMLDEALPVCLG
jgi:hypothetical protein